MSKKTITVDGNYAAAHVAYALSEVSAIYPITPSSTMGEWIDEWSSQHKENIWGKEVSVAEMQSEAGAAGAVHGSLAAGSLTSTYTASQGLLLMIPVMHKIAGEMLPTVFHVAARALAAQSLAIFGDHTDVMGCRNTGFAMLAANSVQEEMDMALVAHLATYKAKVPFLQFFDGFRTSHEIHKIEEISYDEIKSLVEPKYIEEFRNRALRPEAPVCKVGAQNTDVYFQGRETVNKYYDAVPDIVQEYMDKVAKVTGRQYHPFDYVGAPDATDVIVAIGSGCETIEETITYLNKNRGTKYGLVKVRLYRPFDVERFNQALPNSVKRIAVLDRTKEPGSIGEPLYLDVVAALSGTKQDVRVIGGRYGLSSKEFTPSMVLAVYKHLENDGFHGFTVGIDDDVTHKSLKIDEHIVTEPEGTTNCMFWGLGSDGTVGANKNSIKIIGQYTDKDAQAYFAYDSKKSFGVTVSHLRFGDEPIKSTYLITAPDFVSCSAHAYVGRYDLLKGIKEGGAFLLNSPYSAEEAFSHLSRDLQKTIIDKKIKFYNVNAEELVKQQPGLRGKGANTVMMVAYFKVSGIVPFEQALEGMKSMTIKTFKKKGDDVVNMNLALIDAAVDACKEVEVPTSLDGVGCIDDIEILPKDADEFARKVIEPSMRLKGDEIPVSAMSVDGVIPTGTACLEKRGIAPRVPKWNSEFCIQCGICASACPHAAIRTKLANPDDLKNAPESFKMIDAKPSLNGEKFKVQVYCEDCTGCGVCVDQCPMSKVEGKKALTWSTLEEEVNACELENEKFFDELPDNVMGKNTTKNIKGAMLRKPLFEFSGACAGCGETPYVKLVSQLYGENAIIANATGCSSIYSGTFPTIPYTKTKEGRGPAWANSLFEDNAEFGYGMRLAVDKNRDTLKTYVEKVIANEKTPADLKEALEKAISFFDNSKSEEALKSQNEVKSLLAKYSDCECSDLAKVRELQDYFTDKSVWIIGGDGWANDIGYGGIDHVLAQGKNVNILVLDTEVYSNTGGQASKSTPTGAVAKFATGGKKTYKKNMGLMSMSYGYVYVASVALGADRMQTLKAFQEAEAYNGPSIIFAYAPCIAHGIDMSKTQTEQKRAVEAGYFPLYRYNPENEQPFTWDAKEPKGSYQDFIRSEGRYKSLMKTNPDSAEELYAQAEDDATKRMAVYKAVGELMK
ncbi:TPA: pyruvate:ferredoxin (flavodoxin) oxidoreductase [Candidatus Gastranaerophilales bacterium HUM_9]|nr:MAG TPA: pyruvate:ferredoxin (flavodoxin) oxidoreductase [Candidatus Gastranaerophilales bacterium HUM_9]HBX34673.1 pyruvate:ferredoxin (flavodoxin) oxidoreductase [Cyanobacteria bacterium UBA11440]